MSPFAPQTLDEAAGVRAHADAIAAMLAGDAAGGEGAQQAERGPSDDAMEEEGGVTGAVAGAQHLVSPVVA